MPSIRLISPSALRLVRTTTTTTTITTPARSPSSLLRPYSSSTTFQPNPSPPRLPPDQQAEFERLQRAVAERFTDPTPLPHEQPRSPPPVPSLSPASTPRHVSTADGSGGPPDGPVQAGRAEEPTTGGVWRGAKPEFEGDTNPKTGEVGGPKTEPLRWGSGGDWSYNGRVTDF